MFSFVTQKDADGHKAVSQAKVKKGCQENTC